jgi:hypothetical protein
MHKIFNAFLLSISISAFAQESTAPKIHGADIYGAKPNRPFLYKIPATGTKPMEYTVLGLPQGLTVDKNTGIISGVTPAKNNYNTQLIAKNNFGADTLSFDIKVGEELSLTPAMGWNSWNVFGLRVTDKDIRNAADVMVSTGLIDHGWGYINIDDGWESEERKPDGEIATNSKFPDLTALSDYIHSKGLKFGIYSSPGSRTCGGFLGSLNHEEQDIKTYEKWGVDYLKYDLCSYTVRTFLVKKNLQKPYIFMNQFIQNSNRDIVYSLCQYGLGKVWKWGKEVGGNSWRTTGDIVDTWASVNRLLNKQKKLSAYASPGHWNDPDMLVLGIVGWNNDSRKCRLTEAEQQLHFGMWSMLASPLLLGCDLTKIDSFTMSLITNDDIIALNQDRLGKQAAFVFEREDIQVWSKPLADGSTAIGIINLGTKEKTTSVKLDKISSTQYSTSKNLWNKQIATIKDNSISATIPSHGIVQFKLSK